MKDISNKILITVFCVLIAGLSIATIVKPDRVYSEAENRNLAGPPTFTASNVANGDFMEDFENYITDQFVLRDSWVSAKSACELALGKHANNNVVACGDRLIKLLAEPDKADLDKKIAAINIFDEKERLAGVPCTFAIIPTAACIYKDKLPKGALTADEAAWTSYIYDNTTCPHIDLTETLESHADEYIYYRTDHHFTSLGAAYTAEQLIYSMLPDADFDLNSFEPVLVSDNFKGTSMSSSGMSWIKPDSIFKYVDESSIAVQTGSYGKLTEGSLYHDEMLEHNNQYPYFLGGNTPLAVLHSSAPGEKLLIIRDSYADTLAPFLANHYSEIHLYDLRYNRMSVSDYIEENEIDKVLILYSFANFEEDTNIPLLAR